MAYDAASINHMAEFPPDFQQDLAGLGGPVWPPPAHHHQTHHHQAPVSFPASARASFSGPVPLHVHIPPASATLSAPPSAPPSAAPSVAPVPDSRQWWERVGPDHIITTPTATLTTSCLEHRAEVRNEIVFTFHSVPAGVTGVYLPSHMLALDKHWRAAKDGGPQQGQLELFASVVGVSALDDPARFGNLLNQAATRAHQPLRPRESLPQTRPDKQDGPDSNVDFLDICSEPCHRRSVQQTTRSTKAGGIKKGKVVQGNAFGKWGDDPRRLICFHGQQVQDKELQISPSDGGATWRAKFQLNCYAKHWGENAFVVIFTFKDAQGNFVAQSYTPPLRVAHDAPAKNSNSTPNTPAGGPTKKRGGRKRKRRNAADDEDDVRQHEDARYHSSVSPYTSASGGTSSGFPTGATYATRAGSEPVSEFELGASVLDFSEWNAPSALYSHVSSPGAGVGLPSPSHPGSFSAASSPGFHAAGADGGEQQRRPSKKQRIMSTPGQRARNRFSGPNGFTPVYDAAPRAQPALPPPPVELQRPPQPRPQPRAQPRPQPLSLALPQPLPQAHPHSQPVSPLDMTGIFAMPEPNPPAFNQNFGEGFVFDDVFDSMWDGNVWGPGPW